MQARGIIAADARRAPSATHHPKRMSVAPLWDARGMSSLAPCLMFVGDQTGRAQEAMDLYAAALPGSQVLHVQRADDDTHVVYARMRIAETEVVVMDSPAPHRFVFTPAVSLFADLDDTAAVDAAWAVLSDGGAVLMPLQAYPFSPHFGWCNDRFGVSWQLRLAPDAAS
jgi:predicted 3-demethylubiquinone-9 3-methyltransferase (glyoxalase superfamily)